MNSKPDTFGFILSLTIGGHVWGLKYLCHENRSIYPTALKVVGDGQFDGNKSSCTEFTVAGKTINKILPSK